MPDADLLRVVGCDLQGVPAALGWPQASATTAVVLTVVTTVAYSTPLLAVWVAWAGITAWAVSDVHRRHA